MNQFKKFLSQKGVKKLMGLPKPFKKAIPTAHAAVPEDAKLEPDEEWYTDNEFMAGVKVPVKYSLGAMYRRWEPLIGAKITHISGGSGGGGEMLDDKGRVWSFVKGHGTKYGYKDPNSRSWYMRSGPPRQVNTKAAHEDWEFFDWTPLP